jgi:hypothetical protein
MANTPITVAWTSYVEGHANVEALPATFGTPATAWGYGAATDLIETDKAAAVAITAKATSGKIGFCLITPDHSGLASEQVMITPDMGETTVKLTFAAAKSPARILVRNFADGANAGVVEVKAALLETA